MKECTVKQVIYLHGFNSSPQAYKAECLRQALKNRQDIQFDAPNLYDKTEQALLLLADRIANSDHSIYLVGSSLGGYFATYFSERFSLKTSLINPAMQPYTFENLIGEHIHEPSNKKFEVTAEDLSRLKQFDVEKISQPQNFLLLLQTGDQTLDYRQALTKFNDSQHIVEQGGSHQFDDFERMVDPILDFFGLKTKVEKF